MAIPDLHALANAPGFGKAQAELKAAGIWNHDVDAKGNPTPEWAVEVEATATIRTTIKVRAPDAETARRLAHEDAPEEDADVWTVDEDTVCVRSTNIAIALE